MIPDCCPSCKRKDTWMEDVDPFTTGIHLGKHFRIKLFSKRGFGFHKVKYECLNCGFWGKYDYRRWTGDNDEHGDGFAKLHKKRFGK